MLVPPLRFARAGAEGFVLAALDERLSAFHTNILRLDRMCRDEVFDLIRRKLRDPGNLHMPKSSLLEDRDFVYFLVCHISASFTIRRKKFCLLSVLSHGSQRKFEF